MVGLRRGDNNNVIGLFLLLCLPSDELSPVFHYSFFCLSDTFVSFTQAGEALRVTGT